VKSLTVLGKLLILTATVLSAGCATNSPYQSASTKFAVTELERSSGSVTFGLNLYKWYSQKLNDSQAQKQTMAVHNALESDYGTVYNWYDGNAKGSVKAVHGYPQGSGFCRVVFSEVTVGYETRSFQETACKETGHPGWRFVRL
jgi:surface antigen